MSYGFFGGPVADHCAGCRTTRDGWRGLVCPECALVIEDHEDIPALSDRLSLGLAELTAYIPAERSPPSPRVARVFWELFAPSPDIDT